MLRYNKTQMSGVMMRHAVMVLLLLFSCQIWSEQLTVGLLVTPYQRPYFAEMFRDFTRDTGLKVKIIPRLDSDYKKDMPEWIRAKEGHIDVLYWQAGQRLFQHVKSGLVHPINDIWKSEDLDSALGHVKQAVQYEGSVYGIPYSYYHWGMYFNKALIRKLGGPARDWKELIRQCEVMKSQQVSCIGLGTKEYWPAAGWFDYVNLRTNGIDFHLDLLQGKIPFTDHRVQEVLSTLQNLTKSGYFNSHFWNLNWDEVMPQLFRGRIGYVLIGNFVVNAIPPQIKNTVGFTPFPSIKLGPVYEEAPVDIFMIPENSPKKAQARQFLKFIASAETQTKLNKLLGYLPPNRGSVVSDKNYLVEGDALLSNTKAVTQYFDRDTAPAFEKKAVKIFSDLLRDGDIDKATSLLEAAREEVFGKL